LVRRASQNDAGESFTPTLDDAPPPAYNPVASQADAAAPDADANLTAVFDNLTLSNLPVDPSVETCLAHLKLIAAFQWMKEDVGFSDGLWGLWDSRAGAVDPVLTKRPDKAKQNEKKETGQRAEDRLREKNLETLSRIREKRWALFVARAVDRYEGWWKSLMKQVSGEILTCTDINYFLGSPRYSGFPTNVDSVLRWTDDMLPPLGEFRFH